MSFLDQEINIEKLNDFLNEAHKNSYASARAVKTNSLRPRSEDYHFVEDNLTYHDTYFGGGKFIGEEIVYMNNEPVWGMNYYGGTVKEDVQVEDIYKFLKSALLQQTDTFSARGPKEYRNGFFEYQNKTEGSLINFSGKETILVNQEILYQGLYHGGLIN